MPSEIPSKHAALEALLFHYGEAVSVTQVAKFLELSSKETTSLISLLNEHYENDPGRGLTLLLSGSSVQLVTKASLSSIHAALITDEFREELTPVALETLALIAYLGPITRPMIDYIRGVNTTFTLRSLLMRGLVERVPLEKGIGFSYGVSFDFLSHLGLKEVRELPDYAVHHDTLKRFEIQQSAETSRAGGAEEALKVHE